MRAACSAWPVICVRRKRPTDRGALNSGGCALGTRRFALPRTGGAHADGCRGWRGRGSLCRAGGTQCADGRLPDAPRATTPRYGEVALPTRRDDILRVVPPWRALPLVFRAFGLGGVGCGGWEFVLLPCVGTLPPNCRAFGLSGVGCGGWEFALLPCAGTLPPSVEPRGAGLAGSRQRAFGTLVFHSLHHSFSRCQH